MLGLGPWPARSQPEVAPLTRFRVLALILGVVLSIAPIVSAQIDPAPEGGALPAADAPERRMFETLNVERIRQGLTPVAWSPELATAAARHSADMAANGFLDHDSLDGSTPQQRAARAGYVVPSGTAWLVIEALSARPSMEAALEWLLADGVHRRVLLRATWREVGIGYASGGRYGNYWTLDFGCRPNVLPVFAGPSAAGPDLTLTFTQENCAPAGGGADQMGRATEVMVSPQRDFVDAVWEPFGATKQLARPSGGELNVRLRDASGRSSAAAYLALDSLPAASSRVPPAPPTPTVAPTTAATSTPMPTPTWTPTAVPTATPTAEPTATPEPDPAVEDTVE